MWSGHSCPLLYPGFFLWKIVEKGRVGGAPYGTFRLSAVFGFGFVPRGWSRCRFLPISEGNLCLTTSERSSAEFDSDDIFKGLSDVHDLYCKRPEHVAYIRELERWAFVEQYRKGNCSLILQVPTERNRDVVGRLLRCPPCAPLLHFSSLIFYLNAVNGSVFDDRQEKAVFVINVQIVNRPDGFIPSLVRLYLAENKIEKRGCGALYFNPAKRSFNLVSYRKNGEFSLIVDARRAELGQNRHPCVIESAMKIVDRITEHQSNIVDDLIPVTKIVLQHFISTVRIYLNGSNRIVWQSGDNRLHFDDVLLGPVDFATCAMERV
jgi:hypothetical protein